MAKTNLTAQRLRELLHYNPNTGIFIRTAGKHCCENAGGIDERGRVRIRIDGERYKAHRLAWLYVYGVWPVNEIDHKNGNPADNRIDNLRDVTHKGNTQNRRKAPFSNKSSGIFGASRHGNRWRAIITKDGKRMHLGTFDTPEQANYAYIVAKRKLHETCTV